MDNHPQKSVPGQWMLGTSFRLGGPIELEDVKKAGLDCIELTFHNEDIGLQEVRRRIEETVAEAARLELAIWSMHIPYGDEWDPSIADPIERERVLGRVSSVLRLARDLKVDKLVYHPSNEPIKPEYRENRLAACGQSLETLMSEARSLGIRLAVECLPRTCLGNNSSEMTRLVAADSDLGICCDVNHLTKETPEQFIRQLGARIVTTHISDNDGLDEKHWLPGKGTLSWNRVIAALAETGYRGAVMYEVRDCNSFHIKENWDRLLESYGNGYFGDA